MDELTEALSDSVVVVREMTANALGAVPSLKTDRALTIVVDDQDEGVRAQAMEALAGRSWPPAIESVGRHLRSETSSLVRASALMMLGASGSRLAVRHATAAISDDEEHVRAAAASALGALGYQRGLEPLLRAAVDSADGVRAAAVDGLGGLGNRAPVDRLARTVRHDWSANVRLKAVLALGRIGHRSTEPSLIEAARDDPDDRVRRVAALSLRHLR